MALNRLEIGTKCVVRSTGESGTIKQIYFYPTKYELEFSGIWPLAKKVKA